MLPDFFLENDYSLYALYLLMFLVGIGIGSNKKSIQLIKSVNMKIVLVPLSVIVGTYIGVFIFTLLQNYDNAVQKLVYIQKFSFKQCHSSPMCLN